MVWNTRDYDDPVAVVSEGLIVAVGYGGTSTDGGSGCHWSTSASINQCLDGCSILKVIKQANFWILSWSVQSYLQMACFIEF